MRPLDHLSTSGDRGVQEKIRCRTIIERKLSEGQDRFLDFIRKAHDARLSCGLVEFSIIQAGEDLFSLALVEGRQRVLDQLAILPIQKALHLLVCDDEAL